MELTPDLLKLYLQPYSEKIKQLEDENAKLRALAVPAYRSEHTDQLFAALSKAQAEYLVALPNRTTHYWGTTYEDLDAIIQSARAALGKHSLSLVQQITQGADGSTFLDTTLGHESGQWVMSRCRINPTKDDPSSYASLLGHYKRHAAQSILGVTIKEDPLDDNGEIILADQRKIHAKGTALNKDYRASQESYERITKEQLEELDYEVGEYPELTQELIEDVYKNYKIESLADLPKSRYREARNHIVRVKNIRTKPK